MTPAQALAFLDSLARFGMRFGLERMHRLLDALGRPERGLRVLHVAGTNGKGSTCAFAASMLRASGRRVGLYTSPHLVRPNERINVDGVDISDAALAEGVAAIRAAFPQATDPADPLTFFEFGTALALWHFAREGVETAVLETGLGGRLDATNAVASQVAVVTRIGLDHTALLGPTLAAIAGEKAGILKPGARAVIARQPPEALEVLAAASPGAAVAGRDFALEGEGPFAFRSGAFAVDGLTLGLAGSHQRENAEAAIEAVRLLEPGLAPEAIRRGLAEVRWPGRLEAVGREPLTLLDGAHNPDGARALAEAMRALYPRRRIQLVFGALGDKDVRSVADRLVPLARQVWLASPKCERALDVRSLQQLVAPLGVPAQVEGSVAEALEAARAAAARDGEAGLVLVAGSLYVVGEAKAWLESGR